MNDGSGDFRNYVEANIESEDSDHLDLSSPLRLLDLLVGVALYLSLESQHVEDEVVEKELYSEVGGRDAYDFYKVAEQPVLYAENRGYEVGYRDDDH